MGLTKYKCLPSYFCQRRRARGLLGPKIIRTRAVAKVLTAATASDNWSLR